MSQWFVLLQLTMRAAVTTGMILTSISIGWAQVRSSTNYQIQSDSVNVGGGYSASDNYVQESTVGEIATGPSESSSYSLRAGYQQMNEVYLAMTVPANVTMNNSIPGIGGGFSVGSTSVKVTTDAGPGYQLQISAEGDPAMQKGGDSIADYNEGADPDFLFTVGATEAVFGYSPEGPDIVQAFLDNTTDACNEPGGSDTANRCWAGLTTSNVTIAQGDGPNQPIGATTTLQFRIELGGDAVLTPGTYVATSTLTAIPL